jgi:hypothetical protein
MHTEMQQCQMFPQNCLHIIFPLCPFSRRCYSMEMQYFVCTSFLEHKHSAVTLKHHRRPVQSLGIRILKESIFWEQKMCFTKINVSTTKLFHFITASMWMILKCATCSCNVSHWFIFVYMHSRFCCATLQDISKHSSLIWPYTEVNNYMEPC